MSLGVTWPSALLLGPSQEERVQACTLREPFRPLVPSPSNTYCRSTPALVMGTSTILSDQWTAPLDG